MGPVPDDDCGLRIGDAVGGDATREKGAPADADPGPSDGCSSCANSGVLPRAVRDDPEVAGRCRTTEPGARPRRLTCSSRASELRLRAVASSRLAVRGDGCCTGGRLLDAGGVLTTSKAWPTVNFVMGGRPPEVRGIGGRALI